MKLLLRHSALALAVLVPLLFASPSEACGPDCGEETLRDELSACLAGNLGDFAQHGPECRTVGFLLLRGMSPADKELITRLIDPQRNFPMEVPVWTEARKKVPVPPPQTPINTEAAVGDLYFSNCLASAFEVAAKTLEERIAKSGLDSPEVAVWVKAQDAVFLNCGGDTQVLPEPAAANAPPAVRADRAYQTAAALFYARAYDEALQHLDTIAQDKSSPWRGWARLVAVRAVIRQATLKASAEEEKRALLEKARERCVAIVKDPELKDLHRQTRQLTWFIDYRLRPDKQLHLLGRVLLEKPDANFDYAWRDYFLLRAAQPPSNDELSLFLGSFDTKEGAPSALAEWKQRRSLPWLVAALAQARGTEPELPELLKQSESVPKSSPGFISLRAARARLALQGGRWDEARKEFLAVLEAGGATLHPRTALEVADAFRRPAVTFEEWARYAHLSPQRAGAFFSHGVPLSRFKDPKMLAALDANLRREVVLGGWTRAVLLDRWDEAKALEPQVEAVAPDLAASLALVKAREKPEERKMAAVLLLLKSPGVSPYVRPYAVQATLDYDICSDNGWCGRQATDFYKDCDASKGPCDTRFISVEDRRQALQELQAVEKLGKSPELLIRFTLDYAKRHPDDALVPEALHESVRQTRFARNYCSSVEDESKARTELSKEAFQLLRRKYAKTEWAKKTPYYY